MSSDDESTTVQPKPRYQLQSNTQSFEPISLSSRSSQWYHQTSTAPLSSNTSPTRNSSSGYTTSTIHQSPFGGVNQWGTPTVTPAFTPSPYIPLQAITFTPIHTMEVSSFFRRIEKFSGRPSTISLREFRVLSQPWFVNWNSSMALITPRHLHSNNWPVMCTMRHWMSTSNILQRFWASLKSPIQLMPHPLSLPLKLHCKL